MSQSLRQLWSRVCNILMRNSGTCQAECLCLNRLSPEIPLPINFWSGGTTPIWNLLSSRSLCSSYYCHVTKHSKTQSLKAHSYVLISPVSGGQLSGEGALQECSGSGCSGACRQRLNWRSGGRSSWGSGHTPPSLLQSSLVVGEVGLPHSMAALGQ